METTSHPREQSVPQVGAIAPIFTLRDEKNQPHSLVEELRAGKPIVLFLCAASDERGVIINSCTWSNTHQN